MEKQIDEMAKVLKDYTKKNGIMASHVILEDYAEALYNTGCRKQSEGEWLYKVYDNGNRGDQSVCSICGKEADGFIHGYDFWIEDLPRFCPNCGAKMKGANDGKDS